MRMKLLLKGQNISEEPGECLPQYHSSEIKRLGLRGKLIAVI
jgi:hypothetical protein